VAFNIARATGLDLADHDVWCVLGESVRAALTLHGDQEWAQHTRAALIAAAQTCTPSPPPTSVPVTLAPVSAPSSVPGPSSVASVSAQGSHVLSWIAAHSVASSSCLASFPLVPGASSVIVTVVEAPAPAPAAAVVTGIFMVVGGESVSFLFVSFARATANTLLSCLRPRLQVSNACAPLLMGGCLMVGRLRVGHPRVAHLVTRARMTTKPWSIPSPTMGLTSRGCG
jgi:hypothetical protein